MDGKKLKLGTYSKKEKKGEKSPNGGRSSRKVKKHSTDLWRVNHFLK